MHNSGPTYPKYSYIDSPGVDSLFPLTIDEVWTTRFKPNT